MLNPCLYQMQKLSIYGECAFWKLVYCDCIVINTVIKSHIRVDLYLSGSSLCLYKKCSSSEGCGDVIRPQHTCSFWVVILNWKISARVIITPLILIVNMIDDSLYFRPWTKLTDFVYFGMIFSVLNIFHLSISLVYTNDNVYKLAFSLDLKIVVAALNVISKGRFGRL